ncbi:MAG: BrnT family toxin [Gammaproteobacteria bacterium]|nr:BrnT family toxin [Gammaproteobacteria bacterium]
MFEFDERKSRANTKKHGIDCIEAQELWADPDFIEIPATTMDEPWFLVIGRIGGKHESAVSGAGLLPRAIREAGGERRARGLREGTPGRQPCLVPAG